MMTTRSLMLALLAAIAIAVATSPASGQQLQPPQPLGPGTALSCTASLVTSFSPCLNFITNDGASPTADCCRSLGALVKASTGCACLILTGAVPLGVPINRTLAVTLPRACNSTSVPMQCRDASAAAPAPGPVAADAPAPSTPSSSSSLPPAATQERPETEAPAPEPAPPVKKEPAATPPAVSQGQTKPTVVPSSSAAWKASSPGRSAAAGFLGLLVAAGAAMV